MTCSQGSSEQSSDELEAATQAALLESEKFVSELEGSETTGTLSILSNGLPFSHHPKDVNDGSTEDHTELGAIHGFLAHKNASKRSLDDADLDDAEKISPSEGSPGSKRSRVL